MNDMNTISVAPQKGWEMPLVKMKTQPVLGVEFQVIEGCFKSIQGIGVSMDLWLSFLTSEQMRQTYKAEAAATARHAAHQVQSFIALRDKAEEDARIQNGLEAKLREQEDVSAAEQARRINAENTVTELSIQLGELLIEREQDAEADKRRLKETELQLADARIKIAKAALDRDMMEEMFNDQHTKCEQSTALLKGLNQEKTTLEEQIQLLERKARATVARDRFRGAVFKILRHIQRKRWLTATALLARQAIHFEEKAKKAEVRALIWKGTFYAQIPLLERKFSEYFAEEHRILDESIANLGETGLEYLSESRLRTLTADDALGFHSSRRFGKRSIPLGSVQSNRSAGDEFHYEPHEFGLSASREVIRSPSHIAFPGAAACEAEQTPLTDNCMDLGQDINNVTSLQPNTKEAFRHVTCHSRVRLSQRRSETRKRLQGFQSNGSQTSTPARIFSHRFDCSPSPPPYTFIQARESLTSAAVSPGILRVNNPQVPYASHPVHSALQRLHAAAQYDDHEIQRGNNNAMRTAGEYHAGQVSSCANSAPSPYQFVAPPSLKCSRPAHKTSASDITSRQQATATQRILTSSGLVSTTWHPVTFSQLK